MVLFNLLYRLKTVKGGIASVTPHCPPPFPQQGLVALSRNKTVLAFCFLAKPHSEPHLFRPFWNLTTNTVFAVLRRLSSWSLGGINQMNLD